MTERTPGNHPCKYEVNHLRKRVSYVFHDLKTELGDCEGLKTIRWQKPVSFLGTPVTAHRLATRL